MAGGRKLMVEVISARDLMPKDGQGSSNAYCVVRVAGSAGFVAGYSVFSALSSAGEFVMWRIVAVFRGFSVREWFRFSICAIAGISLQVCIQMREFVQWRLHMRFLISVRSCLTVGLRWTAKEN